MSWDLGERNFKIKSSKKGLEEIVKKIDNLKKKNKDVFSFQVELFDDYGFVNIEESGMYKYGGFRSRGTYNFNQFINDVIMCDKDNTTISREEWDYNCIYSYENGEIVCKTDTMLKYKEDDSKEEKIKKVREDFDYFMNLPDEERCDYDIQMASLKADYPEDYVGFDDRYEDKYYTDEFLDTEEAVRAIFKYGRRYSLFKNRVSDKYKNNKELMYELLPLQPGYIACLNEDIKSDKELILKLIKYSIANYSTSRSMIRITDVSRKLLNDKKIALNFIKHDLFSVEHLSNRLKKDYDVCKTYIMYGGTKLEYIDNVEILNDKEIILKVLNNRFCREYDKVPDKLKSDKEVLATILASNNISVRDKKKYKEKLLKMSLKDMILHEMKNNKYFRSNSWSIIPNEVYFDKDFIYEMVEINKKMDAYSKYRAKLNYELLNDEELMKFIKENNLDYTVDVSVCTKKEVLDNIDKIRLDYDKLNEELKNDKDIILAYSKYDVKLITKVSDNVLSDNEIRKILLREYNILSYPRNKKLEKVRYSKNLEKLKKSIISKYTDFSRNDLLELVHKNGWLLDFFTDYYDDKEMILNGIESYLEIYTKISDRLKNDYDVVYKVSISNGQNGSDAYSSIINNKKFNSDKQIILNLLSKNKDYYKYLNNELKNDDEIIEVCSSVYENLMYFPESYRNDKDFVEKCLKIALIQDTNINFKELVGEKLLDDPDFIMYLCYKSERNIRVIDDVTKKPIIYDLRKNIKYASDRIKYDLDFVSELFNIKNKKSIIDLYIDLMDLENDFYLTELFSDVKYLRNFLVKAGLMNDVNDYPEYKESKDLTLKIYYNGDYSHYKNKLLTDDFMKDRDFVIRLLKDNIDFYDIKYKEETILSNFKDDKEIMDLYSSIIKKIEEEGEYEVIYEETMLAEEDDEEIEYDENIFDDSDVTEEDLKVDLKTKCGGRGYSSSDLSFYDPFDKNNCLDSKGNKTKSDEINKIVIHDFLDTECEFNKKIDLDYFFDYQDFLNELDEFKFDLKYEVKDNYIYFSEVNISLMDYFEYVIILERHKKVEGRSLASRLFMMFKKGNENSIRYLKEMTKDYTKEDYKNKIFDLLKDDNSSNANYIKGEVLYSINNKDGIDYLINSLNKDDSCKYYLGKPKSKCEVSVNDKINYQFMDTCIKISDYYVSLNDYDKALEYINKGIDYFPYSYVVYNKKKDIYNKLNLNTKDILKEVKENILLKYVNMDLYKFEDVNNYKEFINKIKE